MSSAAESHASPDLPGPFPFIVGVPRSGTTMLRLMLDAHPDLAIPPETYFVTNLIEAADGGAGAGELADALVSHRRFADLGIDETEYRRRLGGFERPSATEAIRAAYRLYSESQGKRRWGDKTPAYLTNIAEIATALPEARFVHLIRDGRDVALSILAMPERDRPMRNPDRVGVVAKRWRKRIESARRQSAEVDHYLEVRYEELVVHPEPVLRRVCDFLELGFENAMLDYHGRAERRLEEMNRDLGPRGELPAQPAEARIAPHALASKPPSEERIAVWRERMTPEQLAEFEDEAGELLRELGYEPGREGVAS